MANLPTRVLRHLAGRGHAMLCGELQAVFSGQKNPRAVPHAVESLKLAKLVCWTDQGWLPTAEGRRYLALNTKLSFDRRSA